MKKIKKLLNKYLPARIWNYSSHVLWVVETTTKIKGYTAVAHKLLPGRKSPKTIEVDGVRRWDGEPIEGHKAWWKLYNQSQVGAHDSGDGVILKIFGYRKKVSMTEFGEKIFYDPSGDWGEKIVRISNVKRDKKGRIEFYWVEGSGWVQKGRAIQMASNGKIDRVIVVQGQHGAYLRSRPDDKKENNISEMGRSA